MMTHLHRNWESYRPRRKVVALATGIAIVLLAASFQIPPVSPGLSPAEARGRSIYRTGISPSGVRITASMGEGGTEIEGQLAPCGSCHGMDGRGRPEGSIVPPSIRWEDLTRTYQAAPPSARERGPYNEQLLVRAITMGFDSKGNRLNAAMPHYALTRSDAADVIAYLKKISRDYDPGLSDEVVRIAVLLPSNSKYPGLSPAIQSSLTAYFAELNKGGGLYGRQVELLFRELPPEPQKAAPAFRSLLEQEQIFAFITSFVAGSEKEIAAVLQEQKVPLVGAWTVLPEAAPSPNSPVFYLDSGLRGQAEALAAFAVRQYAGAGNTLAFVVSHGVDDELAHAAVDAARSKLAGSPWVSAKVEIGSSDAAGADALVQRLSAAKLKVVFPLLRRPQLIALLGAIKRATWKPVLLIPSALSAGISLQSFPGPVFLAIPWMPSDLEPDAAIEYQKLVSAYGLSRDHRETQFIALAEAKILTEALKRSGRELSRERLIGSLESLYDFHSGFSQPVTFGASRRIGITRFHVVSVDPLTGALTEAQRSH